jgi:hypothetical protein
MGSRFDLSEAFAICHRGPKLLTFSDHSAEIAGGSKAAPLAALSARYFPA